MQINSISQNINVKNNPNFKAGKVRLFSDFDKTFFPGNHHDLFCNYEAKYYDAMKKYFDNFRGFLNRTKKDLSFSITTGRTYAEFETMAEKARERNLVMPLPDTLIVKNGSDEHIRTGTDEAFYKGGFFPFDYTKTNKKKEEDIKKLTGWDGPKIKAKLKELFNKYDLKIVEAGTEHSKGSYGWRSLFDDANPEKLHHELKKEFVGTDKPEWKVGLRNDGNLKIFYTLPPDFDPPIAERAPAIKEIDQTFWQTLREEGVKLHGYSKQYPNECGGRPYTVFEPLVDENMKYYASKDTYKGLNKLYDTKKADEKAQENNDLVVVAGDSSNDEIMLNPMFYIGEKYADKYIKDSVQRWKFLSSLSSPNYMVKKLDENENLRKMFFDLPFMGVIVKSLEKHGPGNLSQLIDAFGQGKYKKIIVVEHGHLQDGVKEAIKLYSEQHPTYAEKLGSEIKTEVFGAITNENRWAKPLGIAGAVAGAGGLGYMALKKDSKKESKI